MSIPRRTRFRRLRLALLCSAVALLLGVTVAVVVNERPAAAQCGTPSGAAPGGQWCPVHRQDFSTSAPEGSFRPAGRDEWRLADGHPYATDLRAYPDGWGTTHDRSVNFPSRTASVVDEAYGARGVFVLRLRTEEVDGTPRSLGGSFYPVLDPDAEGSAQTAQTYGRYTVRFRTRGGHEERENPARERGYGSAFLLWPANDRWSDGEVDFPEMAWGDRISGYVHRIGDPAVNAAVIDTSTTTDAEWVTATIEWSPGLLRFLIDGEVVGETTESVPSTPFRWGFQSGGMAATPGPEVTGELYVDSYQIDAYVPD